jgi:hypothetical protein
MAAGMVPGLSKRFSSRISLLAISGCARTREASSYVEHRHTITDYAIPAPGHDNGSLPPVCRRFFAT